MVVGDLDSQVDFLLWEVILADGEDGMRVDGSKGGFVVENRRGMVVVVESRKENIERRKRRELGEKIVGRRKPIMFYLCPYSKKTFMSYLCS